MKFISYFFSIHILLRKIELAFSFLYYYILHFTNYFNSHYSRTHFLLVVWFSISCLVWDQCCLEEIQLTVFCSPLFENRSVTFVIWGFRPIYKFKVFKSISKSICMGLVFIIEFQLKNFFEGHLVLQIVEKEEEFNSFTQNNFKNDKQI